MRAANTHAASAIGDGAMRIRSPGNFPKANDVSLEANLILALSLLTDMQAARESART
jgi:hypothetical protein